MHSLGKSTNNGKKISVDLVIHTATAAAKTIYSVVLFNIWDIWCIDKHIDSVAEGNKRLHSTHRISKVLYKLSSGQRCGRDRGGPTPTHLYLGRA